MTALSAAVDALGELVGDYYVEAERWPDIRCSQIRDQALTLDRIRTLTIRGRLDEHEAFAWLDMGRITLATLKATRVSAGIVAVQPEPMTLCDHEWRVDGMADDDRHYCTRTSEHSGPHLCGWCEDLERS